jgi:hypothetical protein
VSLSDGVALLRDLHGVMLFEDLVDHLMHGSHGFLKEFVLLESCFQLFINCSFSLSLFELLDFSFGFKDKFFCVLESLTFTGDLGLFLLEGLLEI